MLCVKVFIDAFQPYAFRSNQVKGIYCTLANMKVRFLFTQCWFSFFFLFLFPCPEPVPLFAVCSTSRRTSIRRTGARCRTASPSTGEGPCHR